MANTKMQLQYRVTNGYNPVTKQKILRPVIANRKKMNLDQIVEYCLNAGFVRGQFHDMRGNLNGFIEGMQQLGRDGHDLNLADWFRIHAELTKTVDESRQLTSKNELRVNVTVLKELKRSAADFSWTNIDDNSLNPKITKIAYLNGSEDKVIKENLPIVFTGTNLTFHEGDKTTATYKDAEAVEHVIQMASPVEFTDGHQKYDYPDELKGLENGTAIEFAFYTRGGIKDGPVKPTRRTATLIAAGGPKVEPKIASMIGEKSAKDGVVFNWEDPSVITLENASTEGAKVRRVLYDADGDVMADTGWDMEHCTLDIVSPTVMKFTANANGTKEPSAIWANIENEYDTRSEVEVMLLNGTILKAPLTFESED